MSNEVKWSQKAAKQVKKIASDKRKKIILASHALQDMPATRNVKALKNHKYGYRLRVGDYRILFNWNGAVEIVNIEEVKKRDEHTY
ncbi:type II toxin-antitoxin system RelE family toxin [Cernens ardua]|uniref:type II toxin-antitoxin system RelE family toxin n=1 Tax=Cernens ardua TaxID=3402176 RepID=UPI003F98CC4C